MFTNILYVNKKIAYRRFVAAQSKHKAIKYGNTPWSFKRNRKRHSQISEQTNKSLSNWIIHHSQVLKSPIENDCMKVKIDGYTEPQLVSKCLFQVSVR